MTSSHVPVLLSEVLQYLDLKPGSFVIDGTVDGGGHAKEILQHIGSTGKLLGLDWDEAMLKNCRERLGAHENIILLQGNYAELPEILRANKLPRADALLLDLGFSSEQLEASGRGFSFNRDEPLLMTYNDSRTPLREVLPKMREEEIKEVLSVYGEERFSGRIARVIYSRERRSPIQTSGELAETVLGAVPGGSRKWGGIHPATRTFQAFRIYVNGELENLKSVLANIHDIVRPGGRVAIISFHSLEDRIVKNVFRDMKKENKAELLTKKPVTGSREEIQNNPRSRSAKLRAITIK